MMIVNYEIYSYGLLSVFILILLTNNNVFAHGVHSGISGCPVGGCGVNDWYYLQFMKDVTFQLTLVAYGLILGIFLGSVSSIIKTKIRKNLYNTLRTVFSHNDLKLKNP